jgi:uncharacterized membrane protein YccC
MNKARQDRPADRRIAFPPKAQALKAIRESTVLAVTCLVTYWIVTSLVYRMYSLSQADNRIGGLWAVLSAIFVLRGSYEQSVAAAVSRMSATLVSFALCLLYLAFLPYHLWAFAVLIGASALAVTVVGRPGDAITAAISTAVVMVSASISTEHVWQQPLLRLGDTFVGVAIGVLAAWLDLRVFRDIRPPRRRRNLQSVPN